jgi:hypothetical protein
MEALALVVPASRSTVSRFFAGRAVSLSVTRRIVEALGLKVDDVLRLATDEEVAQLGGGVGDAA